MLPENFYMCQVAIKEKSITPCSKCSTCGNGSPGGVQEWFEPFKCHPEYWRRYAFDRRRRRRQEAKKKNGNDGSSDKNRRTLEKRVNTSANKRRIALFTWQLWSGAWNKTWWGVKNGTAPSMLLQFIHKRLALWSNSHSAVVKWLWCETLTNTSVDMVRDASDIFRNNNLSPTNTEKQISYESYFACIKHGLYTWNALTKISYKHTCVQAALNERGFQVLQANSNIQGTLAVTPHWSTWIDKRALIVEEMKPKLGLNKKPNRKRKIVSICNAYPPLCHGF